MWSKLMNKDAIQKEVQSIKGFEKMFSPILNRKVKYKLYHDRQNRMAKMKKDTWIE